MRTGLEKAVGQSIHSGWTVQGRIKSSLASHWFLEKTAQILCGLSEFFRAGDALTLLVAEYRFCNNPTYFNITNN